MQFRAGTRIGPYEILAPLGAGGMGEVYRALDARLGREVALKVLGGPRARDRAALERFEREARAASALNHPNIVTIYEFGRSECDGASITYIAMELIEGQNLRQIISEKPMELEQLLDIAVQAVQALAAAHGKGIVHRDLKPENMMVSRPDGGGAGLVKILDFGLAKLETPPSEGNSSATATSPLVTGTGTIMGTAAYMSPEQASGKVADFRADLFSFGAVLYEMATGRRAFQGASAAETLAAILRDEPETISQANPAIPIPLQWAIKRCLAKNPEGRYAATLDLAAELAIVRDNLSAGVPGSAAPAPLHLPSQRTPLVGRDRELDEVKKLLMREEARLVVLTGPGGTGKTRLAVRVASDVAQSFPGGVYFVSLAQVTEASLVGPSVAKAIGVREAGGKSAADTLKEHLHQLRRSAVLLLLDNFEQVLSAAPLVADLLEASPAVKILVTSRSLLRIYGEYEFQVPPLALPDMERLPDVGTLARIPAVALFVQRAAALKPGFSLSEDNMRSVAQICAHLDGLPLAIELAAARIKLLSPAAMLERLQSRLQWLTGGARDLPERQKTLRATLDWSYELLQPAEQKLFRRLAVFASGCTLESAEAVCNPREDLEVDLLDAISSLVDKSLLQQNDQGDGEARFRMLETIREYAAGRLAESGEESATHRAQAAYCLVLGEEGAIQLTGPQRQEWLNRFDLEHENFRSALEWLIKKKSVEWGLRLGVALNHYWLGHGFPAEGREYLLAFLKLEPKVESPDAKRGDGSRKRAALKLRAQALSALSGMAIEQVDFALSLSTLKEALAIYRELGDLPGLVMCLNHLSVVNRDYGNYANARSMALETIRICQEAGDMMSVAHATSNLASVARTEGDLQAALALEQECFSIYRDLGDQTSMAWSLNHQGDVAMEQGELGNARSLYEQALGLFRKLGDKVGIAHTVSDLGNVACNEGSYDKAEHLYPEALSLFFELGEMRDTTRVLEGIACAAADRGDYEKALRLAGAAAAVRQGFGTPLTSAAKAHLEKRLESARAKLATSDAARAWMEGSRMTSEAAVKYALNAGCE